MLRRTVFVLGLATACGAPERPNDLEPRPSIDGGSQRDGGRRIDGGAAGDAGHLPGTDLALFFVRLSPRVAAPGGDFSVVAQIQNAGTDESPGSDLSVVLIDEALGTERGLLDLWVPPIDPGESYTATLALTLPSTVAPQAYAVGATVDVSDAIEETDETNNEKRVGPLYVSDVVPSPDVLVLDSVAIGCRTQSTVVLANDSSADATITGLSVTGANDAVTLETPDVPFTLGAGTGRSLTVSYAPTRTEMLMAQLELTHDRFVGLISMPIVGRSTAPARMSEVFTQPAAPPQDILLVIDNSASMTEEQAALGNAFSNFLANADAEGVDYHIAVTTTDVSMTGAQGAFVGPPAVITPTTPDNETVLRAHINRGAMGSPTEQGLEAARRALSAPMIDGPNAGFLRTGSNLSMIFLSDEDDQGRVAAATYATFFQALVAPGGPASIQAHGLIGLPPNGCVNVDGTADSGDRYLDVITQLGGIAVSICDADWSPVLDAALGSRNRTFALTEPASPATVEVRVDGTVEPEGNWVHDAIAQSIVFTRGAAPPAGATVTVDYEVACR